MSKVRGEKIVWAGDNFNSTVCGSLTELGVLKDVVSKMTEAQLPFQLDYELVECSWGGEDCSKTKCCNDFGCDKNYEHCWGYSCFVKTEYFSGCATKPEDGWDGKWLGGPREHRNLPPAGSQVALQGRSLYCFTVVTWDAPRPKPFWNSESELANFWKQYGIHVEQCDGFDYFDGQQTTVAEWGSFSNIDLFMQIWDQVKAKGAWKGFDWTVKVDTDAVFIPGRLKDHLYNLRTPRGARVYLENIDYKFKFMGALEILTREAVELFMDKGHTCLRGDHAGGEDAFMKTCLDGLGVDHQADWSLLRDRYAGLNPPCVDGWAVAYHYMKKTKNWAECYNEVMCGSWEQCDKGIPVPADLPTVEDP